MSYHFQSAKVCLYFLKTKLYQFERPDLVFEACYSLKAKSQWNSLTIHTPKKYQIFIKIKEGTKLRRVYVNLLRNAIDTKNSCVWPSYLNKKSFLHTYIHTKKKKKPKHYFQMLKCCGSGWRLYPDYVCNLYFSLYDMLQNMTNKILDRINLIIQGKS